MCSDCTSFRLQEEKASDFAERYLREVEELAVPLMNELASMRMLMDRSLIMKPKGTRLPYAIHSEVKGASMSALQVEEMARRHLKQITRDTNLHCKIMALLLCAPIRSNSLDKNEKIDWREFDWFLSRKIATLNDERILPL